MIDKSGEMVNYMLRPLKIVSSSGPGFCAGMTGLEDKLTYFGRWSDE